MKTICVYCSSSNSVESQYMDLAAELGREMVANGYSLVFGGAKVGLMGVLARQIKDHGGRVVGVMPELLVEKDLDYKDCDELIITPGMRERKAKMEELSSAFITLPGSFGTLEELLEVITLKQLGYHRKAIVILNHDGFFDHLLAMFEHLCSLRFAKPVSKSLYHISNTVDDAINFIRNFEEKKVEDKWMVTTSHQSPRMPGWAMPL